MPDSFTFRKFTLISILALLPLLAWDASGLDLPTMRWFGDTGGFRLRHNWWLEQVLHADAQWFARVVMVGLIAMIWTPLGAWRRIDRLDRLRLAAAVALAALAILAIKHLSTTSCPWDLAVFGGSARHVSHWYWAARDGGGGGCFPAGHASIGFSLTAGWFWLRNAAPRTALSLLSTGLLLGFALGAVQVIRGAHYPSHVLWTGWICWMVGGLFWFALRHAGGGSPGKRGVP